MTDTEQTSGRDLAARRVRAAVALVLRQPGPRGGLTERHLWLIVDSLAVYIQQRFPGKFDQDEAVALAHRVVVCHFAGRYASFSSRVVHRDDPVDELLMSQAKDLALDFVARRRPAGDPPLEAPEAIDAALVRTLFGASEIADVITALRSLLADCAAVEHRVVCCYLDAADRKGCHPTLLEVAVEAGVSEQDVHAMMLRFANRLGRCA